MVRWENSVVYAKGELNVTTQKQDKERQETSSEAGLTPQQVMEMGGAASHLLQNPVYNVAHRMAVDEVIDLWSRTSPKEVNLRESLWHELQALGKASVRLSSMVSRAEELLERQANEPRRKRQEYEDEQGFNLDFPEMAPQI